MDNIKNVTRQNAVDIMNKEFDKITYAHFDVSLMIMFFLLLPTTILFKYQYININVLYVFAVGLTIMSLISIVLQIKARKKIKSQIARQLGMNEHQFRIYIRDRRL